MQSNGKCPFVTSESRWLRGENTATPYPAEAEREAHISAHNSTFSIMGTRIYQPPKPRSFTEATARCRVWLYALNTSKQTRGNATAEYTALEPFTNQFNTRTTTGRGAARRTPHDRRRERGGRLRILDVITDKQWRRQGDINADVCLALH